MEKKKSIVVVAWVGRLYYISSVSSLLSYQAVKRMKLPSTYMFPEKITHLQR
jgi:hypothetical protein